MQVTQSILDVKLQCPLGGAYEIQYSGDNSWWTSTAWSKGVLQSDGRYAPPEDYSAPWIQWFRGAKIHVTQQDDSLSVVGNIKLDMPPIDSTKFPTQPSVLPQLDFDIFQLPMKLFGGTASEQKSQSRGF